MFLSYNIEMEDYTPPKDSLEDAQIKFQRLCEVASDIEKEGTAGGDQTKRQFVIAAITNSDNEFLYEIMEQALFDENHPEILKTLLAGLLANKKISKPLIKLINESICEKCLINKESSEKESLILASDAVICAIKDEVEHKDECLETLEKAYIASCLEANDYPVADRLLQLFINTMPGKSKKIDDLLISTIKNKELEVNPKLVAIEILTRSKGGDVFENLTDILMNIHNYAKNQKEAFFLLDVTTKAISALLKQGVSVSLKEILELLNSLNFIDTTEDEYLMSIVNRIKDRIKDINEMYGMNN